MRVLLFLFFRAGALLLLALLAAAPAVRGQQQHALNVYQPCLAAGAPPGSLCRRADELRLLRSAADGKASSLPVDMRLPCTNASACAENVDAVQRLQPQHAPARGCSLELMPWSAFPCAFDAAQFFGVPGQNNSVCYNNSDGALTTDGYNNIFRSALPALPRAAGECDAAWAAMAAQRGAQGMQLRLQIDFRVAAGRQFDRTYSLQFGDAVAALGTCSEPSGSVDKAWSVSEDITYLQTYLQPGLPVRFSLANLLSNTYNVPIWARATLLISWPEPDYASASGDSSGSSGNSGTSGDASRAPNDAAAASQPADVPDEVLPLVPAGRQGDEALATLSGTGDSPAQWPRVEFELPPGVTSPGNVYRAQLLVVPKANACEEFWAMNPSGPLTNDTCGGVSTGEPYREVRVYVDGQVAGFQPIYYTMYTGGIDPRLWTAIVPSFAYSLPRYAFDLSPWLPLLNAPSEGTGHRLAVELGGATGSDWVVGSTLLLWRARGRVGGPQLEPDVAASDGLQAPPASACEPAPGSSLSVAATCVTEFGAPRFLKASAVLTLEGSSTEWLARVRYAIEAGGYRNVITFNNSADSGSISWRQTTRYEARAAVTARRPPNGAWGRALVEPEQQPEQLPPQEQEQQEPPQQQEPQQQHQQQEPRSHATQHRGGVLTQRHISWAWLNAGAVADGAPYELSFNMTLLVPTVFALPHGRKRGGPPASEPCGEQRHYQRAIEVSVYNPPQPAACPLPDNVTHTVALRTSVVLDRLTGLWPNPAGSGAAASRCATRWATCAFCAPALIDDVSGAC